MTERIWRCSCGGSHFLSVTAYDDEKNVYVIVEEYPEVGHWKRLKACWNLLRNRRHTWIELVLSEQTAQELIDELQERITHGEGN